MIYYWPSQMAKAESASRNSGGRVRAAKFDCWSMLPRNRSDDDIRCKAGATGISSGREWRPT